MIRHLNLSAAFTSIRRQALGSIAWDTVGKYVGPLSDSTADNTGMVGNRETSSDGSTTDTTELYLLLHRPRPRLGLLSLPQ